MKIAIRKELTYIPSEIPIPDTLSQEVVSLQTKYSQDNIGFEINAHRQYHVTETERQFSPPAEAIFEAVRKSIFPPVQKDRYLAEEIERLTQWIARGQLVALANEHVALSE